MSKLLDAKRLGETREWFVSRGSRVPRVMVWCSFATVLVLLIWTWFAPIEEVVRAQGAVRPTVNVSSVRNIVPGRIISMSYSPGENVSKGQELLRIDPAQLWAQMGSLEAQFRESNSRLSEVESILLSLAKERNLVPATQERAWTRYQSWLVEDNRLVLIASSAKRLWQEEVSLPPSATTAGKVRDKDAQARIAEYDWGRHQLEFRLGLLAERDVATLESKRVASQIEQLRIAIENTTVISPLTGTIQEVSSLNIGDYLQSDQSILRVVPRGNDEMRVAIHVPARLAGKLAVGMSVNLRFPSFPFSDFGGANGLVQAIDPDTSVPESGEVYFVVLASLDRVVLADDRHNTFPLRVGLQVDARFVLRSKPVLSYILEMLNL